MSTRYSVLSSECNIGNVKLKNRIMTSGHQTTLVKEHLPTDDFIAYHKERARGGCGLIVLEANGFHKTGLLTPYSIDASKPEVVDIYSNLANEVHKFNTKIFAQLLHNGSEAYISDDVTEVVSSSAVPTDRFHIIPRELEEEEIEEIIEGFVNAAVNIKKAGLDGVELTGSHNYLFAQFWNPRSNKRTDQWGGTFTNRLRFAREVIERVRKAVGTGFVIGMRISLESKDSIGTTLDETYEIIKHLNEYGLLNYWSLVVGSSSTLKGSSFIVPPSTNRAEDLFSKARKIKQLINPLPLIVTSRIYSPDIAEKMLKEEISDVVGMTRALIADPYLPKKAFAGDLESIIPCIACNQGCIDRYQKHLPIRCTVNPVTGRESIYKNYDSHGSSKRVLVVGGGPAGIMAAITAKKKGHEVLLVEKEKQLGGQLNVITGALHRKQVKGWKKYLIREIEKYNIKVEKDTAFHSSYIQENNIDNVILATGSKPLFPELPNMTDFPIYTSNEIIEGKKIEQNSVLIMDWKGDWAGLEAAELLANQDKTVELVSATYGIGESLQQYLRNDFLKRLDQYGVIQSPQFKLKEVKKSEVIIQHLFNERFDTRQPEALVLALGSESSDSLRIYREIKNKNCQVTRIGDAKAPRTLDEAVFEGFRAGMEI